MVVDASVWVSSFFPTDARHSLSRRWLSESQAAGHQFAIPTLALVEVAGAVASRSGVSALGEQAANRLSAVVGLRIVNLDRDLADEAAVLAARLQLRGADAIYASLARRLGLTLWTWDAELSSRAGRLIPTRYPSNPL